MSTQLQAILDSLRKAIPEVSPTEAESIHNRNQALFLDVRNDDELSSGIIEGSIHICRGYLELEVESVIPKKESEIYVYCAGGTRSLFAAKTLIELGYSNVRSIAGGFNLWKSKGLPIKMVRQLTESERKRYNRHLIIPEIGEVGQLKLIDSKVLIVGAGGLGCPIALYLSAAGVGTIGIIDFDVVDESNLQRQILHSTDKVGMLKTDSAKDSLNKFNHLTKIVTFNERLTTNNAKNIFKDFDVIIDGSDNFQTRYLVNDVCVKLEKPCIHGSVFRFEGQVSVFDINVPDSPCYRCIYPEAPPPEMAPSCAEAGVLGVLPGIIGLLEAIEAIKCILKQGDQLVGRLIKYDAWAGTFDEFTLRKNPNCKCCVERFDFLSQVQDAQNYCTVG